MFDGEKIARKALLRAHEIEAEKKHRRIINRRAAAIFGLFAASAVIALLIFPPGKLTGNRIFIYNEQVPLAAYPILQADEYATKYFGAEQCISIPNVGDITAAAETHGLNAVLFNPVNNPCYFTFEIILTDKEESIYKSGLIEPGMCIENPALLKELEKGEYKAVLVIRFYDLESLDLINTVSLPLNIIAA